MPPVVMPLNKIKLRNLMDIPPHKNQQDWKHRLVMITRFLTLIYAFTMVCSSAHSLEFTELTEEVFNTKVVGKTWLHSSYDGILKIQADGSVTLMAPTGDFVGKWEFINGKGFCREGKFAGKEILYDCEEVKLVGNRIFIFVNRGKPDDAYVLLID